MQRRREMAAEVDRQLKRTNDRWRVWELRRRRRWARDRHGTRLAADRQPPLTPPRACGVLSVIKVGGAARVDVPLLRALRARRGEPVWDPHNERPEEGEDPLPGDWEGHEEPCRVCQRWASYHCNSHCPTPARAERFTRRSTRRRTAGAASRTGPSRPTQYSLSPRTRRAGVARGPAGAGERRGGSPAGAGGRGEVL